MELLFFLSIPVFYILGITRFISWIFSSKKKQNFENREDYIKKAVEELEIICKESPNIKLKEQLEIYKKEYAKLNESRLVVNAKETYPLIEEKEESASLLEGLDQAFESKQVNKVVVSKNIPAKPQAIISEDLEEIWQRWYQDNSINLLLYIGAFLIVASASIFVGFQWEALNGITKAFLVTLLTLAFFVSGVRFYKTPKVANAGVTFCTIGSLLIPLSGLAWYNFVFKPMDLNTGIIWFITSLTGIFAYLSLAFYLKKNFYVYTSTLGILSLNWSLVNIFNLPNQAYILGAIISAIILLIFRIIVAKKEGFIGKLTLQPLEYSSNVMMPTALTYGLIHASVNNQLFTAESTVAASLGVLYYLIAYLYLKLSWYLIPVYLLLPLSLTFGLNWQHSPTYITSIVLAIASLSLLPIIKIFINKNLKEETDISSLMPQVIAIATYILSLGQNINLATLTFLSSIVAIAGLVVTGFRRWTENLLVTSLFLAIGVYHFVKMFVNLDTQSYILGVIYFSLGVLAYLLLIYYKRYIKLFNVMLISAGLMFLLSYINFIDFPVFLIFINLALSFIFYSATYEFKKAEIFHPANIFLAIGLYQLVDHFLILDKYSYLLGLIFLAISITYYLLTVYFKSQSKMIFNLIISAIMFGVLAILFTITTQLYFALVCIFLSSLLIHACYKFQKTELIYPGNLLLAIGLYQFISYYLTLSKYQHIPVLIYLAIGIIYFIISIRFKKSRQNYLPFIYSSIAFTGLSLLFSLNHLPSLIIVNSAITVLLIYSSFAFSKYDLIYVASLSKFILVINILKFLKIPVSDYPFIQIIVSFGEYLIATTLPEYYKKRIQLSALTTALLTPLIYNFYENVSYQQKLLLNRYSLISSYFSALLWVYHAYLVKKSTFGYAASVIVLAVYIWQISYIGVHELLYYTIPLGLYFLGIAYSRKVFQDIKNQKVFDYLGSLMLLFPAWVNSFANLKYSLILGLEGIFLVSLGISLKSKLYNYFGLAAIVLAVISQTYEQLFALPRWVITGIAGFAFLAVAIYLLWHKKEEAEEKA